MSELLPQNLTSIEDVARYWMQCLRELDAGVDDKQVASHMVGVVASSREPEWSNGTGSASHPAYPIVFELAGQLELPPEMTAERSERWMCIRALVAVMKEAAETPDSP